MQEFVVLIMIALAVILLPRMSGRRSVHVLEPEPVVRWPVLTGWMRLAVLVTVFWIAGAAAFLKPWDHNIIIFLYVGMGPVVALWGAAWVWSGYKKYRR